MKVKKTPLRTCVVTHELLPKSELLRIVATKEGDVFPDETGKKNGRGAYIKKDLDVLEKAIKTRALEKKLGVKIEESVYDEIRKIIEK